MKWLKNLNTPNKLTLLRMLCVVAIIVLFLIETFANSLATFIISSKYIYVWIDVIILILFILGSITDFLDGHIARKYNLVTIFGKFLDPIADKLLVNITAFFTFFNLFDGKLLIVPIIYIFRDTIVDGIRLIAAQKNIVIAASNLGKAKTTAQMWAIILCLALGPIAEQVQWLRIVLICLALLSLVISLVSGIDYLCKNIKTITED